MKTRYQNLLTNVIWFEFEMWREVSLILPWLTIISISSQQLLQAPDLSNRRIRKKGFSKTTGAKEMKQIIEASTDEVMNVSTSTCTSCERACVCMRAYVLLCFWMCMRIHVQTSDTHTAMSMHKQTYPTVARLSRKVSWCERTPIRLYVCLCACVWLQPTTLNSNAEIEATPPAERRMKFLAHSATTRTLPTASLATRTLQTNLKDLPVAEEVEGYICYILCVFTSFVYILICLPDTWYLIGRYGVKYLDSGIR